MSEQIEADLKVIEELFARLAALPAAPELRTLHDHLKGRVDSISRTLRESRPAAKQTFARPTGTEPATTEFKTKPAA